MYWKADAKRMVPADVLIHVLIIESTVKNNTQHQKTL